MKVKTNTKAGSALWAAKLRASETIQNPGLEVIEQAKIPSKEPIQ